MIAITVAYLVMTFIYINHNKTIQRIVVTFSTFSQSFNERIPCNVNI